VNVSPIEKTVELLSSLSAKVVKDGEAAQKAYEEFSEFCDDESKELQFAIETGEGSSERSSATIAEAKADISSLTSQIAGLAAAIATNEKDLAAATEIRNKEAADFQAADADLAETIDMLSRAARIIEKEMKGSSFVQSDSMARVADALQTLVDASAVNSLDKARVQALLQSDDMQPAGAPEAAAYESQSGGILATLEDMLEKAQAQRAEAQKAEMNAAHAFAMLKQKLNDEIAAQTKEMNAAKAAKAEAEETKAAAEGALANSDKGVSDDKSALHDLQHECMTKATAFDVEQKERAGELEALAKAKSILEEKTGGATERAYSFVQIKASTETKESNDRMVALVQRIAKENGSTELAQLASRLRSAIRESAMTGANPFGKVKGMIAEMIDTLEKEAKKEAGHKAFCDEELSETGAKRDDKTAQIDKLNTKIDKATAKIAKLKEDVATLESELAAIAKAQAEADAVRNDEKAAWAAAKADYESGLEGVGMALQVLRDYYAGDSSFVQSGKHEKATGAASGIIGMLEVIESDFSKLLAEGAADEHMAQEDYDKMTQENKVTTTMKRTEVTYKEKDAKETANRLAGDTNDRSTTQTELDAVMEYWDKLQPMCVAKPEPYEVRKKRREAEIAGLKEALQILENESAPAFLQMRK